MFEIIISVLKNLLFFVLHLNTPNSFPKPLTATKEKELLLKMKSKDSKARNELIEHNLRLVAHIIKKYYSSYSDQDDLISIGTVGLIKGIDTFDMDKGTRLATYAARCIENEILMYFRIMKKNSNIVSMNDPIDIDSEGNPLTLIDIIYSEDTIADDIDLKDKTKLLYSLIDDLTDEREKTIIIKRYGLYNQREETQREIAKELGISRSYVSRIETKVIGKLREKIL